jgi:hypothetical protein
MVHTVPVDRDRHGRKRWRRPNGYGFAANLAVAPLGGSEFSQCDRDVPDRVYRGIARKLYAGRGLGVVEGRFDAAPSSCIESSPLGDVPPDVEKCEAGVAGMKARC